jgi:hypothetical protein
VISTIAGKRHNKIWKRSIDIESKNESVELIAENNAIMMYSPFLNK